MQGVYIDQSTTIIVDPAPIDSAAMFEMWLELFGVAGRRTDRVNQRLVVIEQQLSELLHRVQGIAAHLPPETKGLELPHDRASLEQLKGEIDRRLGDRAKLLRAIDLEFAFGLKSSYAYLTGFRFADRRFAAGWESGPRYVSRFSDGTYPALYFAEDLSTAAFEVSVKGKFEFEFMRRMIPVEVRARLHKLVDLTDPETFLQIEKQAPGMVQEITRRGSFEASQQLGKGLVHAGFDGCIYPSPNTIGRRNIVIFPANMGDPSEIEILAIGSRAP